MLKLSSLKTTAAEEQELNHKMLVDEFRHVTESIRTIESNFNQITDDDLVDYYIMLLKAEENRRKYLYRQLKGE